MGERWTTAQVAEYCGVRPSTYRDYVSDGRAPGPLPERDPQSGAKLYDADAVREWHANRPGAGARTDLGQMGQTAGATVGQTAVGTCPDESVSESPETTVDQRQRPDVSGTVAN
jgi:hypothetical protein